MGTNTSGSGRASRLLDIVVLLIAAPVIVPVGVLCALAIRLDSSGPALFRQERVGKNGSPFTVYKFRTMVNEPNPIVPDASRITRVGKILRRFSLDELPQLINVANGTMSIVGPRPTLQYQVDRYSDFQRRRLEVRPGLTGLAQVNGRNALNWDRRIELDVEYVERQSLLLDLQIIARTIKTVLSGEGIDGHDATDPLVATVEATRPGPAEPAEPAEPADSSDPPVQP